MNIISQTLNYHNKSRKAIMRFYNNRKYKLDALPESNVQQVCNELNMFMKNNKKGYEISGSKMCQLNTPQKNTCSVLKSALCSDI